MKRYISNILLCGVALCFLSLISCSDILEEQPRSIMTPEFFKTDQGLAAGLSAAYSGLRTFAGTQSAMFAMELGTDEFTAAASCTNNSLDMTPENQGTPINSETGDFATFWNSSFSNINTCNGIIEYGTEGGVSPSLIAEAKFLRAYLYFQIVQMFGGAPLDLGSGELKFNTAPSTMSIRNSVDEVYTAIIKDLQDAIADLPENPRMLGAPAKKSAYHYLAKVYLTKGDYQLALSTAEELINNPSTHGVALLPTYADVIKPGNEHNSEVLFTCERTNESYTLNGFPGAAQSDAGGDGKDDRSLSYFTPNYPTFHLFSDEEKPSKRLYENGALIDDRGATPVARTIPYSRPWIRMAPTYELITKTFADKTNDTRYYATFQSVWLNNNATIDGRLSETVDGKSVKIPLNVGDTAFYIPGYNVSEEIRASKNYRIWNPDQFTRSEYPSLQKFFDPNRKALNDASGRPFMLAKFSETYLIAAEAAIKLNQNTKARDYILEIRKRAAAPGCVDKMITDTPANIDIDYLLDERSRELCGEQMRWLDLVRTKKWVERAGTYHIATLENIKDNGQGTLKLTLYTRKIEPHYYLRPIPKAQLDLMNEKEVDKGAYQNPGY